MNLKITGGMLILSILLFSCRQKLPIYDVYNGLKVGEEIPSNGRVPFPDSLNTIAFTELKNKNSSIFYYKKNFNGKDYLAIIDRRGTDGVLSNIYIYFASFTDCSRAEKKENFEYPIRNCLMYENPNETAINPLLENYIKQMLIDKYGNSFDTQEFLPENYTDEDFFRTDIKIKELTWIKDYLQIKLVVIKDSWGFMRLALYYSLTKKYFTDFKTQLSEIKKTNSNF